MGQVARGGSVTAHYYNEFEPYAAQWIRNLIKAGEITDGVVDERSIVDVAPSDLEGFTQCHFFAGIAGWPLAARIAGWPAERELWSGSAPCQPYSVAGKGLGAADERDLWPHYFRLIRERRPNVAVGEQVAAAIGKDWLDRVFADLEGIDYACGSVVIPACAVNAPHRRDRLWFLAHSNEPRLEGRELLRERGTQWPVGASGVADPASKRVLSGLRDFAGGNGQQQRGSMEVGEQGQYAYNISGSACAGPVANAKGERKREQDNQNSTFATKWDARAVPEQRSHWDGAGWLIGHDKKIRRVEPAIRLLAHGVPGRVGRLRAYGNAIVPQVAAEVLKAWMECAP